MNIERKLTVQLFKPFVYVAGARALGLGLAAIFLTAIVGSLSNTHFDGVLDVHVGAPAPLWFFLAEGVVNWLCLSFVLLIFGRIFSSTSFRSVDLFGTQALARWPAFIISVLTLPSAVQRFGNELLEQLKRGKFDFNGGDAIVFLIVAVAMIPFICWMVVLMYQSYSVSCNVKGGKGIGTFIAGLVIAEVVSKLCLAMILSHAGAT